nr:short-chain dehydrogenase/reductase family 42E member 1 [Tanacetum cinerariifolium]
GARLVRAFDFRSSSPFSHLLLNNNNNIHLLKGDIVNRNDVDKALRGVDCVFHLASFGMSGKEMLQYGRVDDVNINGTCHVLEACHQNGVKRLVYVSTSNVVFAGNEIVNGNEKLPYLPLDNHVDPYSRSKSIAEQLVLKSNSRPLKDKNGECLYTCAVRPAAIYGPGEERHLPRIINLAKLGLLPFKIGEPSVKSDWVYIDNLVLALIQASMGLLDDIPGRGKQPVAAGQPYFISDDDVNINGTCHVLEACHQNGVKRLVYVSTSNVVFAGNEIVNGNEKLPYLPLDNHVDPYSRSKSIAEQLVLKSNGRPLKYVQYLNPLFHFIRNLFHLAHSLRRTLY